MEGQRSGSALPWSSTAKGNKETVQQPTWVEAVKKGIYHEKTCHVCVLQVPSPWESPQHSTNVNSFTFPWHLQFCYLTGPYQICATTCKIFLTLQDSNVPPGRGELPWNLSSASPPQLGYLCTHAFFHSHRHHSLLQWLEYSPICLTKMTPGGQALPTPMGSKCNNEKLSLCFDSWARLPGFEPELYHSAAVWKGPGYSHPFNEK